jgi:hypothetical protein
MVSQNEIQCCCNPKNKERKTLQKEIQMDENIKEYSIMM